MTQTRDPFEASMLQATQGAADLIQPQPAANDAFEQAMSQAIASPPESRIHAAAAVYPTVGPDKYAQAQDLAESRGTTADAVLPDFEHLNAQAQRDNLIATAPKTAAWAGADPGNYAIAQDDLQHLSGFERAWDTYRDWTTRQSKALAEYSFGWLRAPLALAQRSVEYPIGTAVDAKNALAKVPDKIAAMAQRSRHAINSGTLPVAAGALKYLDDNLDPYGRMVREGGYRPDTMQAMSTLSQVTGGAMVHDLIGDTADNLQRAATEAGKLSMEGIAQPETAGALARNPWAYRDYLAVTLTQSLPAMALAMATRKPALAGNIMGVTTGLQTYSQDRAEGVDPYRAAVDAGTQGVIERSLGSLTFEVAQAPGLSAMNRLLLASGTEAGTEGLTGAAQYVAQQVVLDRPFSEDEFFKQTLVSALAGVGLGAPVGAVEALVGHPRLQAIETATQGAQFLTALQQTAQNAKLKDRNPRALASLIASLKGSGGPQEAYIGAENFIGLYQSEADAYRAAADYTGRKDALEVALATGGDIAMPIEHATRFLASSVGEAAVEHMKLEPLHPTVGETAKIDYEAEISAAMEQVTAAFKAQPEADTTAAEQDILGELVATGRYNAEDAQTMAKLLPRFYASIATRTGRTVDEVRAKYPVSVISSTLGDTLRRANPNFENLRITPVLEAIRTGKIPSLRDAYGPSLVDQLVKAGGVQDFSGELRNFDAGKARPGLINKAGITPDQALTLARESGFLPPAPEGEPDTLDINDLLDLIDQDLRGDGVFRDTPANKSLAELRDTALAWQAELPTLLGDGESIQDLMALSNQQIMERVQAMVRDGYEQPVFHGSPHRGIEQTGFSLQKIGTGEGQQAYGFGLYFASIREVAESYRHSLSRQIVHVDGKKVATIDGLSRAGQQKIAKALGFASEPQSGDVRTLLNYFFHNNGDWSKVERNVAEYNDYFRPKYEKLLSDIRGRVETTAKGQLYAAHVPEDSELLDYDKPLSEQPAIWEKLKASGFFPFMATDTGSVYAPQNAQQANALLAAGIPGLRYLDGTSRGKGEGSANYVIWDEAAIRDVKTFYQPADGTGKTARGSIQFPRAGIGNGESLVRLAETADRSTFLHEMGHFYLEVLANESIAPDAPESLRRDFGKILDWFGIPNAETWAAMDLEAKRPFHEQFARGFERYLAEGKAPAQGLRGAFRRFKSWLLETYSELSRLNVDLTPDIRGVFDRLLATEDEINAAAQEAEFTPALPIEEARKLGMSEAAIALYAQTLEKAKEALGAKLLNAKYRETRAWYRQQVRAERERVAIEAEALPVYRAIAALRQGKGVPGPIKLDKAAIVSRYGEGVLVKLRGMYAIEGGQSPALVADALGWSDGDTLLEALLNAKPKADHIRGEAEARVQERNGDPMTDGTIGNLAMEAIHNSRMAGALQAELDLLAGLANEAPTKPGVIREAARRIIASRNFRDLRPHQFLVAERKAANAAQKAAAAGKYGEALAAKRQQALNAALYSEATQAEKDVERTARAVKRLGTKKARGKIGKAGGDYLEQLDALLTAYAFSPLSRRERDRRDTLRRWYDRQVAEGKTPTMPESVLKAISGPQVNYQDATVTQMRDLYDALIGLRALAYNDLSVALDGQRRELEAVAVEMGEAIRGSLTHRGPPPADAAIARDFWHRIGSGLKVAGAALIRLQTLGEWIDGNGNVNGPFHRYIIRPLARAQAAYLDDMHAYSEQFVNLLAAHAKATGGLDQRFRIASIGETFTKAGVLSVALNVGNEDNLTKLRDGRGWGDVQLAELLAHMTKADWDFVQSTWDLLETLWPRIADQQKRMTGLAPPKVAARPVPTPFGVLRGGYFPMQYDRTSPEWLALARDTVGKDGLFEPDILVALPQNGHTKARVASAGLPLKFDLQGVPQHLSRVLKDLTHRETLADMLKLTTRKEVTRAIQETLGQEFNDMVGVKLREVATDQQFASNKIVASASRVGWAIRRRVGVAVMGLNTITGLKQLLGITSGTEVLTGDLGLKSALAYHTTGYLELLKHWGSILTDASTLSGEMRHRLDTASVDVRRTQQEYLAGRLTGGVVGKVKNADAALRAHAHIMLRYVQTLAVDLPLWYGAMKAASEVKGLQGDDAVAYADSVVLRSQGGGGAKDTAIIEGMPGAELFTMFYSYASAFLQRQVTLGRDVGVASRDGGKMAAFAMLPHAAARLALGAMIPVLLESLINQATGAADPPDDDEWLAYYLKRLAAFQFYGLPIFRDTVPSWFGASPYEARLSPAQSAIDAAGRVIADGKKVAGGEDVEGRKLLRDSVNATAIGFGLPIAAPYKSADYLLRVMDGEEDPESIPEFTAAFIAGKREDR